MSICPLNLQVKMHQTTEVEKYAHRQAGSSRIYHYVVLSRNCNILWLAHQRNIGNTGIGFS